MKNGPIAADPILVPSAIGGIVVVKTHATFAGGGGPLLADGATFGDAADFTRADLLALRVGDFPLA